MMRWTPVLLHKKNPLRSAIIPALTNGVINIVNLEGYVEGLAL
ncbi:MAG: hypothetical protein K0S39_6173 [Paenibacillus sp.]|jgi:hypothetical protein|nr:hypothetical protein [Paenibacillus sp.]